MITGGVNSEIDSYRDRLGSQHAAARYATRFERGSRRRTHLREQAAVAAIFDSLTGVHRVIDVPCGAGRFLNILGTSARELTLMDTSAEVLELAKARAKDLGVEATFIVGDASKTGLSDGCVDAVFSNRLLHHIADAKERALFLREFHRITSKYVVVSFFDYLRFGPLRTWLKRLKGRRVDYKGQPTQAAFEAEVRQNGFRVDRIVPIGPLWVAQKYLVLQKIAVNSPKPQGEASPSS